MAAWKSNATASRSLGLTSTLVGDVPYTPLVIARVNGAKPPSSTPDGLLAVYATGADPVRMAGLLIVPNPVLMPPYSLSRLLARFQSPLSWASVQPPAGMNGVNR